MKRSAQTNGPAGPKRQKISSSRSSSKGAYSTAPLAQSHAVRSSRPSERVGPNGSRSITFCEYVQDVAGSVDFAVGKFPVQPGIATLFAWLASQAVNYNEYRFTNLRFRFETEKAATLSGKVMLAFNPDAADGAPASKQEMLEFENKASDVLWKEFMLNVPVRPTEALGNKRYVRTGALSSNLDIKNYDLGNLWVATQGMADTTAVGELFVEYTVELSSPIVSAAALAYATTATQLGNSPTSSSFFGSSTKPDSGGLDYATATNTITFNRVGKYALVASISGTGLHTVFTPVTSASTANTITVANAGLSNAAADAGTLAMFILLVTITARGQTVVLDLSTVATTVSSTKLYTSAFSTSN